jgi:hypothetical protein
MHRSMTSSKVVPIGKFMFLFRSIVLVFAITALSGYGHAFAGCADVPPASAQNFIRSHKVFHFNGEPPSRVQDELAVWETTAGTSCFLLNTLGPNYHECNVLKEASTIRANETEFKEDNCTLTFQKKGHIVKLIASHGWERMGRGGTCSQNYCGMYGEIESGTFREKK